MTAHPVRPNARRRPQLWIAGVSLTVAALTGSALFAQETKQETKQEPLPQRAERFDLKVRNDFFLGFAGDRAAFDRGMKAAEEVLAKSPKHAEALVWHGAGLFFRAGQAFQSGDQQKGGQLYAQAMQEMDEAVKLEPKSVGVLVPRSATLLSAVGFIRDEKTKKELLTRIVDGYEAVYDQQKGFLDKLGTHPRGELLFGLAQGYREMGDETKAKSYLDMIVRTCKDSHYEQEAKEWLAKDAAAGGLKTRACFGCHTPEK